MVKICPLTQHKVQSGAQCNKKDCVFLMAEGCAITFCARMAAESHQAIQEIGEDVHALRKG